MPESKYPSIFPLNSQPEGSAEHPDPHQQGHTPLLMVPLPEGGNRPATAEEYADAAARSVLRAAGVDRIDCGVVLGSGWKPALDKLAAEAEEIHRIPTSQLEGFLPARAAGHGSEICVLRLTDDGGTGRVVACATGRTHAYEGVELWRTVHTVRTFAAAGARAVVLTNAAGGIAEGLQVGDAVLISDHINATGKTPLTGATFVNLVDAYSPRLRQLVKRHRPGIREEVYAMMPGPQYETPAEIRALGVLGAGLVGMSTVYETIAARATGLEVLGLSLVTNLAAGITGEELNHDEVLAAGAAAAEDCGQLLAKVVREL